jgi:hypothetical protein
MSVDMSKKKLTTQELCNLLLDACKDAEDRIATLADAEEATRADLACLAKLRRAIRLASK